MKTITMIKNDDGNNGDDGQVCSINNQGGKFSNNVIIQRGCRQGDPIASYMFTLCVEVSSN